MHRNIIVLMISFSLYLGLQNGYLCLWHENCKDPVRVYPYHISLYPQTDKELLEKGITITSEAEFSKRIEDYLS